MGYDKAKLVAQLLQYRVELAAGLGALLAMILGFLRSRRRRLRATEEFKRAIAYYTEKESRESR